MTRRYGHIQWLTLISPLRWTATSLCLYKCAWEKKRKAGQEPKPLPCLVGLREDFQLSYHLVVVPSGLAILLTDGCGEVASEVDYELV